MDCKSAGAASNGSNISPPKIDTLPFYAGGLCFSCTRCSACCRHDSGFVFLSQKDASLLGEALNMDFKEFAETYCRWVPSGVGTLRLSLKEKSNYDCVFWTAEPFAENGSKPEEPPRQGGCSVYEKRPLQCRAFPFWSSVVNSRSSWNSAAADCPGMGRGTCHSQDSVEKWLALRQNEPIISRSI